MTADERRAAREACARATPGPWEIGPPPLFPVTMGNASPLLPTWFYTDVRFICVARTALPAALDEIERLEASLNQFLADTTDGMECLPACDSYAHDPNCPVTNPAAAFRKLREEIERLEAEGERLTTGSHPVDAHTAMRYGEKS